MKKFFFRLEKLLILRKNTEKEKIRILALDLHKLYQAKSQLENLNEEVGINWNSIEKNSKMKICKKKVSDFINYYNYDNFLNESLKHQMNKIGSIDRRLAKDRMHLNEAINKRKILEKLKAKKQKQYNQKHKRLIKNNEDEIALMAYFQSA